MRLRDHDESLDPEVSAVLDAIDATLAGEPVDARYAEMAEIALLLAADRPTVPDVFGRSMDERVARRFAPAAGTAGAAGARGLRGAGGTAKGSGRGWWQREFWPAAAALSAAVAMIVGLVVVLGGHGASSVSSSAPSSAGAQAGGAASTTASVPTPSAAHAPPQFRSAASRASQAQLAQVAPASPASRSLAPTPTLQPPTTGRKVVQGAQLDLAAAPNRIDDVAQQVYDVVGALNGIVENSTVTQAGGPGGYAQFQLSVPSGSLGQAMTRLSSLNYAQVLSRTDSTQDITDAYGAAQRSLADARALRTSLLKQLAAATTIQQIASLKAQIRDAEASISSDQATLGRMNHQVGFSQLSLEITARSSPAPATHHSGGRFGIASAAHDAGRVLTVAAGVALIAIAALAPVALLAALAWWVAGAIRRRRREQALDAA